MLEEIVITAEAETKEILGFAISKGYSLKIVDGTKVVDVIDNDGNNVGTKEIPNEIDNTEKPKIYLKKLYEAPMVNDLAKFIKAIPTKKLEEEYKIKQEAIDKMADKKVATIIK